MRLYDYLDKKEGLTEEAIRFIENTDPVAEKDLGDFPTPESVNDFVKDFYSDME